MSERPTRVLYVNSNRMGTGDEELGRILLQSFFKTLEASDEKPERMIFVNSGVRLTTEGSELIATLRKIEEAGVAISSCGTCLDYYGLKEKLKVGTVGNMAGTVESLMSAGTVVSP
jgi:selenium metabolism protein YedF